MKQDESTLYVYADGSADNAKTRCGGWAYVVLDENEEIITEDCGKTEDTTNNRMELTAILNALYCLPYGSKAIVYTDSKYSIGVLTNYQAYSNIDIIQQCKDAMVRLHLNITFEWVKSHSGIKWNEYVDEKANGQFVDLAMNENVNLHEVALKRLVSSIDVYQQAKKVANAIIDDAYMKYLEAFDAAKKLLNRKTR